MKTSFLDWEIPATIEIAWTPGDPGCNNPDSPMFGPPSDPEWEIVHVMVGDVDVYDELSQVQIASLEKQIDAYRDQMLNEMDGGE